MTLSLKFGFNRQKASNNIISQTKSISENLLADIYKYQTHGPMYVCGDCNGLFRGLDDFIRGDDDVIIARDVLEFKMNNYCELFIYVLICEF